MYGTRVITVIVGGPFADLVVFACTFEFRLSCLVLSPATDFLHQRFVQKTKPNLRA